MDYSRKTIAGVAVGVFLLVVVVAVALVVVLGGGSPADASDSTPGPDAETPDPTPSPTATAQATGQAGSNNTTAATAANTTGAPPVDTPRPRATSTPTSTATPTPAPTPTPTPTATPTPTVVEPDFEINRTLLVTEIESEINGYRADNGLSQLRTTGTLSAEIRRLARNHSGQLEADGEAWNLPDEYDIEGLYRAHDLYTVCQFPNDGNAGFITPDDGKLIAVQKVNASSEDESAIAATTMDNWVGSDFHSHKFDYENAENLGVGLAVDESSEHVYVTMSVC